MKHRIAPRQLLIILFWITIWQTASAVIRNDIIFAGPADVVRSFFLLIPTAAFWQSICRSFLKISLGFLAAFFCGILTGCLAFRFRFVEEFLEPVILLVKSIPVASFVILALIWIGSANLSVFISFLVVFPILYVNTVSGLQNADAKLLEMAKVFSVSLNGRIRCIYLPALLPYLVSGCKVALGMSWKSGIAAEVIGVPANTIGENLYMSKIYLATSDLFAWTIVIILVSALFEKFFLALIRLGADRLTRGHSGRISRMSRQALQPGAGEMPAPDAPARAFVPPFDLYVSNLSKSYQDRLIWDHLSMTFRSGRIYCLMGASGSGKTTLFRILLGLEQADSGSFALKPAPAATDPGAESDSATALVSGAGSDSATASVSGAASGSATALVSGVASGSATASVSGAASCSDTALVSGAASGSATASVSGAASCSDTALVSGAASMSGAASVPTPLALSASSAGLVAVFQEDRLCESFSPLENVALTAGKSCSRSRIYSELCRLLPEESVTRPVSTLSGGMKRRVAIARALLTPASGILMDEPFTGLDEDTKKLVISYVKEKSAGKLLIISTHQEEDVALLNGELVRLF